jgi:hypothetical protein
MSFVLALAIMGLVLFIRTPEVPKAESAVEIA